MPSDACTWFRLSVYPGLTSDASRRGLFVVLRDPVAGPNRRGGPSRAVLFRHNVKVLLSKDLSDFPTWGSITLQYTFTHHEPTTCPASQVPASQVAHHRVSRSRAMATAFPPPR